MRKYLDDFFKLYQLGIKYDLMSFVLQWVLLLLNSYESNIGKDPEKERVKPKFASTIMFVEDYLQTVVSQDGAFADRKQNKLTYEVGR